MARLRLTLHNVCCYADTKGSAQKEKDLKVSTEKETDDAYFQTSDKTFLSYKLNLVNFSFKKKMYQPTEIIAEIQLTLTSGKKEDWKSISRAELDSLFKFKKVTLEELSATITDNTVVQTIGNDFYVHEVLVRQQPKAMYTTLKIYSLDKLMTLQQASRTFVAQKLGDDILDAEVKKYITPWTIDEKIPELKKQIVEKEASIFKLSFEIMSDPSNQDKRNQLDKLIIELNNLKTDKEKREGTQVPMTYSTDNMQVLKYKAVVNRAANASAAGTGLEECEHIFPYLVQYNESFYDMLARTANRWGEFLYYENGKLNIGYAYDGDKTEVTEIKDNYGNITYVNLENKKPVVAEDGKFDYAGADEKGFLDSTLRKTPNSVSGILFQPGDKGDKVVMKLISSFLKNEKNLPTYLANLAFDSTYDLVVKELENLKENNDFDEEWFPDKDKPCGDEHYGEHNFGDENDPDNDKGVNLFSEINSEYKSSKYTKILAKEQSVGRNAVCIDFLTFCPKLKLGDIIKVSGELFIVVEISSNYVVKDATPTLVFQVVATAQDSSDKLFYPAMIPAGHVRLSGPQVATIADAGDPAGKNRVRVLFPWQNDDDTSSPWLTFTAGGAGSPVVGKHYEKDKVMIGFIDGNVERPYVLGSVTSKGSAADYIQTTPGGHQLTITDDEEGIANFLTGMFLPGVGTLTPVISLIPGFNDFKDAVLKPSQDDKNNLALGGGFELADKYGIYKISGSTDGREVAIASPWGEVNINAFTGITISAPNGDVTIKGKNVTIEAGNNLEITSGTNVRYKLLGESLDKGAGNVASAFFGNMAGAVAKKLTEMALNIIDLSMIRNVLDIVFRPAEGNMRIKSNRYMMLESGKGECDYPSDAYKDGDTVKKVEKEKAKSDLRPGLKLVSGVVEMIAKVQTLGNKIDSDYRTAYNKCCDLRKQYDDKYADAIKWSDNYDSTKTNNAKICNQYADIKTKVWNATPAITEADLGWQGNYTLVANDIKQKALDNYKAKIGDTSWRGMDDATRKKKIIEQREQYKAALLDLAISLQKAIADLQKLSANGLSEKDIKAQIGAWKDRNIPEDFRKALVTAFDKAKLGDTFFYKAIADNKKDLKEADQYSSNDALKTERKALKRKAATILLEEMGFKDEWRKKIPDPNAPVAPQPAPAPPAPGIPQTPPTPPAPPMIIEVPKKTNEADLTDNYWDKYVQSLITVPPLTPVKWKIFEEAKKAALGVAENLTFWKNIKENRSWGDAKNGTILFSYNENVYKLNDKNIEEVEVVGKENLTEADDTVATGPVNSFLTKVRNKLKELN